LFERIIKDEITFPSHVGSGDNKKEIAISDEAKSLIVLLLKKNPQERLGNRQDYKEILNHPWFY
jgi:hypothetical protein